MTSPFRHSSDEFTTRQFRGAWLVHVFTTLGIVAAMLSLRDILVGRPDYAIAWMLLTLLIDGVDGPIARALEVERRVPLIDGFLLDLIIDYVTCVIVPAAFMYAFNVVPQNNFGIFVLCVVVFTGALWFARKDMETPDHWFRGFPAAWNMVGPMLFILEVRPWLGATITLVLSVLCLSNLPYPHIARARFMRYATWIATVLWMGGVVIGMFAYPDHYAFVRPMVYVGSLYFLVLAFVKIWRDRTHGVETPLVADPTAEPARAETATGESARTGAESH